MYIYIYIYILSQGKKDSSLLIFSAIWPTPLATRLARPNSAARVVAVTVNKVVRVVGGNVLVSCASDKNDKNEDSSG